MSTSKLVLRLSTEQNFWNIWWRKIARRTLIGGENGKRCGKRNVQWWWVVRQKQKKAQMAPAWTNCKWWKGPDLYLQVPQEFDGITSHQMALDLLFHWLLSCWPFLVVQCWMEFSLQCLPCEVSCYNVFFTLLQSMASFCSAADFGVAGQLTVRDAMSVWHTCTHTQTHTHLHTHARTYFRKREIKSQHIEISWGEN